MLKYIIPKKYLYISDDYEELKLQPPSGTYMQRIIDQTSLGKKCDGINGVIKHHLEKIQVMVLMM